MTQPVCIVVGYGPGNGQGIASAFGAAGHRLGLIARTPSKLAGAVDDLRGRGLDVEIEAADAADGEGLTSAIGGLAARLGPPEVLVYNAAAFRMATPTRLSVDDLVGDFRTNVAGALAAANAVIPAMTGRRAGSILFTGGGWALYPDAAVSSTAIGKAGLRHLALMLHQELAGTGVRAGTLTILGSVEAGTPFDPAKIGAAFVEMAATPADRFQPEILFRGA